MSEFQEQKKVIDWFKSAYPKYERSIRLSMNGVNLGGNKKAAMIVNQMKSQGFVKEESDLFFAIPQNHIGGFSGLFIEMKDAGTKPTQGQLDYLEYQLSMGYAAEWCEGSEEAIEAIKNYIRKTNDSN